MSSPQGQDSEKIFQGIETRVGFDFLEKIVIALSKDNSRKVSAESVAKEWNTRVDGMLESATTDTERARIRAEYGYVGTPPQHSRPWALLRGLCILYTSTLNLGPTSLEYLLWRISTQLPPRGVDLHCMARAGRHAGREAARRAALHAARANRARRREGNGAHGPVLVDQCAADPRRRTTTGFTHA